MRREKRMRDLEPIQQRKQQQQQEPQQQPSRNRNRNQQANQRQRVGSTTVTTRATTGGRSMQRQNNRATKTGAGVGAGAACELGLSPTTLMPLLLLLLALLLPLQLLVPTQATPSPSSMQTPQKRGEHRTRLHVILCFFFSSVFSVPFLSRARTLLRLCGLGEMANKCQITVAASTPHSPRLAAHMFGYIGHCCAGCSVCAAGK